LLKHYPGAISQRQLAYSVIRTIKCLLIHLFIKTYDCYLEIQDP
jgi:hypothetical protein